MIFDSLIIDLINYIIKKPIIKYENSRVLNYLITTINGKHFLIIMVNNKPLHDLHVNDDVKIPNNQNNIIQLNGPNVHAII